MLGVAVFEDNWTMTCTLHSRVIKSVLALFHSDETVEPILSMANIINWLPYHLREIL